MLTQTIYRFEDQYSEITYMHFGKEESSPVRPRTRQTSRNALEYHRISYHLFHPTDPQKVSPASRSGS